MLCVVHDTKLSIDSFEPLGTPEGLAGSGEVSVPAPAAVEEPPHADVSLPCLPQQAHTFMPADPSLQAMYSMLAKVRMDTDDVVVLLDKGMKRLFLVALITMTTDVREDTYGSTSLLEECAWTCCACGVSPSLGLRSKLCGQAENSLYKFAPDPVDVMNRCELSRLPSSPNRSPPLTLRAPQSHVSPHSILSIQPDAVHVDMYGRKDPVKSLEEAGCEYASLYVFLRDIDEVLPGIQSLSLFAAMLCPAPHSPPPLSTGHLSRVWPPREPTPKTYRNQFVALFVL